MKPRIEEMAAQYRAGKSLGDLAKLYALNDESIRRWLIKAGIEMRTDCVSRSAKCHPQPEAQADEAFPMTEARKDEDRLLQTLVDVMVKALKEAGFPPGPRTEEKLYEALQFHLVLD